MDSTKLSDFVEQWSEAADDGGWVERWIPEAIFPSEMVFLLSRCDQAGVGSVVESGRQDGYSTAILAQWARRRDGRVVSIDWERDTARAARCRSLLRHEPSVTLLRGDAARLLADAAKSQAPRATALLLDGPKDFQAVSLMLSVAAGQEQVALLALHNLFDRPAVLRCLRQVAGQPLYHEETAMLGGPAWRRLREAEQQLRPQLAHGRPLEPSSLGILDVTPEVRRRARWTWNTGFRLYQPPLVRLAWQARLEPLATAAFRVSVAGEEACRTVRWKWLPAVASPVVRWLRNRRPGNRDVTR